MFNGDISNRDFAHLLYVTRDNQGDYRKNKISKHRFIARHLDNLPFQPCIINMLPKPLVGDKHKEEYPMVQKGNPGCSNPLAGVEESHTGKDYYTYDAPDERLDR